MAKVLVTGASRGIGLELCRQLSARGDEVVAACRQATPALTALGVRIVSDVDVSDDGSVAALARALEGERIDVLINNAGVLRRDRLDALDFEGMRRQFEVNTLGPLRVTAALLEHLPSGARVGIVTSRMGSIDDNTSGGYYGYRVSKAGVNMVGASLAHDLRERGVSVLLLHPGMVATEMTGGQGIPAAEAAAGLIARLDELSLETSGSFRHANGERLPW